MGIAGVPSHGLNLRQAFAIQTRPQPLQLRLADVDRDDAACRANRTSQPDREESSPGADVGHDRAWRTRPNQLAAPVSGWRLSNSSSSFITDGSTLNAA